MLWNCNVTFGSFHLHVKILMCHRHCSNCGTANSMNLSYLTTSTRAVSIITRILTEQSLSYSGCHTSTDPFLPTLLGSYRYVQLFIPTLLHSYRYRFLHTLLGSYRYVHTIPTLLHSYWYRFLPTLLGSYWYVHTNLITFLQVSVLT